MNTEPPGRLYQLADYESVFEATERQEIDAVLVGGQAVCFWALRFRSHCPKLKDFLPYTTKDADFLADVPAAEALARTLNSRFRPAIQEGGMRGLCLGQITLEQGQQVEILGRVNGIKNEDVRAGALRLKHQNRVLKVIHPLQLYIGKGHNLSELDQGVRQDAKHFAMMELVIREFLAEIAGSEEIRGASGLLNCCEMLIDFSLSRIGLKLIAAGHMPQAALWPDLANHPSDKVKNFVRQRVPRWELQLARHAEKIRAWTSR